MWPPHVRDSQDYWSWLDRLIAQSGGYLEERPHLRVELLDDPVTTEELGLSVPRQRLRFHDATFLSFEIVVDGDLYPIDYNFHFQTDGGELIWRKDCHSGHERELSGELTHIHDDPQDPDGVKPFERVHLDEVLDEIAEYQRDHSSGGAKTD